MLSGAVFLFAVVKRPPDLLSALAKKPIGKPTRKVIALFDIGRFDINFFGR